MPGACSSKVYARCYRRCPEEEARNTLYVLYVKYRGGGDKHIRRTVLFTGVCFILGEFVWTSNIITQRNIQAYVSVCCVVGTGCAYAEIYSMLLLTG